MQTILSEVQYIQGDLDEEPPSSLCCVTSVGIFNRISNGCSAWLRKMADVRYISDPMLSSRIRDNRSLLATDGQNN